MRWWEPACRSMPWVLLATISSMKMFARREVREPFSRSGKKAVQVAPVRQIPGMVDKTINIDHRNGDQGSAQALQDLQFQ